MAIYGQQILTGSLPTVGQSSWGGPLNGHLQTIFDVLSAKITPASLLINATVDLDANALDNVGRAIFNNLPENPDESRAVFFKGGELYIRDGAGNVVQITSGGSLNASLLAGFSGDLGTGGSAATYASANSRFTFTSSPGTAAAIQGGPLRLQNGADSNVTTVQSLSGLTGSYTITLPPGTPTATSLLQMDNTGVVTNTRNPSVDALSGSTVLLTRQLINQGSMELTGAFRILNGAITVSGSSSPYKRTVFTTHIPVLMGTWIGSGSWGSGEQGTAVNTDADQQFRIPIVLAEGERLLSCSLWCNPESGCGVTASLNMSTGSSSTGGTVVQALSSGGNQQRLDLAVPAHALFVQSSAPFFFHLKVDFNGTNNVLNHFVVAKDIP